MFVPSSDYLKATLLVTKWNITKDIYRVRRIYIYIYLFTENARKEAHSHTLPVGVAKAAALRKNDRERKIGHRRVDEAGQVTYKKVCDVHKMLELFQSSSLYFHVLAIAVFVV